MCFDGPAPNRRSHGQKIEYYHTGNQHNLPQSMRGAPDGIKAELLAIARLACQEWHQCQIDCTSAADSVVESLPLPDDYVCAYTARARSNRPSLQSPANTKKEKSPWA